MKQYVGLDVSLEETHICVLGEEGEVLWRGKTKSSPDALARVLRKAAPSAVKIGFESGPLSTWHWHALKDMGLPVVCLDARHAKGALSVQTNKTDDNDAYGLAQMVRTGWYKEVKVKSMQGHLVHTLLVSRSQLVGIRTKLNNHLRGILKTFGLVVGKGSGPAFHSKVRELCVGQVGLTHLVDSILRVVDSVEEQIAVFNQAIRSHVHESQACKRLMTIPGVGPMTAAAFVSVIDDPGRFPRSPSVGAYLGLTPRRYQSGEIDRNTRISKCGDHLLRGYLYEAASVIISRVGRWSRLKAWAVRLTKKVGFKKARVALARKLAVIMHRMWMDKTVFTWGEPKGV